MNLQESSFAHARRDERIFNSFLTTKTDFASNFISLLLSFDFMLLELENNIILVEVIGVSDCEGLSSVLHLDYHVLDSAHFYDVSGF